MSERAAHILIADMLDAVNRVLLYTEAMSFEQFEENQKTIDAVVRNLQVLGEAAGRVPEHVRTLAPSIEWDRIVRSRHVVVHNYFGIDLAIVWRIAQVHLPPLYKALTVLLAQLSEE